MNVHDLPSPSIDSLPTLCDNDPPISLNGYGKPESGVWYCTTKPFAVSGGTKLTPSRLGSGTHWLTYKYTHPATGCWNTDSAQITIKDCTIGIQETAHLQFTISPNPARDYIVVTGDMTGVTKITLVNALGDEMKAELDNNRISLEHIPPGLFFIRILSGEGIQTLKGIKLP